MFPPSSPLIERVRIENEKKQFEQQHAGKSILPKLKSLNFLNGKSEAKTRPAIRLAEPCAVENV